MTTEQHLFCGGIIFAGTCRKLDEIYIEQLEYLHDIEATTPVKIALKSKIEEAKFQAKELSQTNFSSISNQNIKLLLGLSPKYWQFIKDYNPIEELKKTDHTVLILQGEKDYQVTLKTDYQLWEQHFANNSRVTMKSYPNLNHLFMVSQSKELSTPSEYAVPSHVDQQPIVDICSWINSHKK